MKNQYKVLIAFVIISFVIIFLVLFLNKSKTFTLLLSPNTVLNYKKGKFENINYRQLKKDNIYDIVLDSGKIVKSKLSYNDGWYYYNKSDIISIDQNFVALAQNDKTEMIPFKINKFNDEELNNLSKYLKEKQIGNYGGLSIEEKISIDLDNDGEKETFYIATNVFSSSNRDKDFGLIVFNYHGKSKILYEKQDKVDQYETMCAPYLAGIMDIDKDKNYEVILGCNYFDQLGTKYSIFRLEQDEIKMLKDF